MDLISATRWLAGISTGACVLLFVATGAMCNALSSQQKLCVDRLQTYNETQTVLLRTLETSSKAVESSSLVIDKVSRIDYFMEQGQQMEQFRTLLTSDLGLDKPVSGLGIGGCE